MVIKSMVTGPWFFGPPCPPQPSQHHKRRVFMIFPVDGVADITLPSENPKLSGGLQSNSSSFSFFFVVTIYEYLVSYSEEFSGDQWTPESNLHGLNYWAYPNYGSIWCTPALTNNSGTKWVCLKIGDPAFDGLSSCLLLKWPFCGLFPVSHDRP